MTKEDIKLSLKRVLSDRQFLSLLAAVVLFGIIYCLVTGLSLQSRDVQVYSRYTAFGEAHFYKSHWQYFITFVLFGAVVTSAHVALMIKLHNLERRQTAVIVGFATLVLLIVAGAYTVSVMRIAFR